MVWIRSPDCYHILCGVSPLLLPLHGFQGSNSSCQASSGNTFSHWAISLLAPTARLERIPIYLPSTLQHVLLVTEILFSIAHYSILVILVRQASFKTPLPTTAIGLGVHIELIKIQSEFLGILLMYSFWNKGVLTLSLQQWEQEIASVMSPNAEKRACPRINTWQINKQMDAIFSSSFSWETDNKPMLLSIYFWSTVHIFHSTS